MGRLLLITSELMQLNWLVVPMKPWKSIQLLQGASRAANIPALITQMNDPGESYLLRTVGTGQSSQLHTKGHTKPSPAAAATHRHN